MAAADAMSPARRFFLARVFPALVVLVGAGALYLGFEDTGRARASAAWPAVDGTITRSTVERVLGASGGRDRSAHSVTYAARIGYEYDAGGARHHGDRISYGHYDTADEADAGKVVARYPVGARVKVRYMPDNPGESVLEPGSHGLPWLNLALGIVFVLVGLALFALAPRLLGTPREDVRNAPSPGTGRGPG